MFNDVLDEQVQRCNHTSVGVLVQRSSDARYLLFKRKKAPIGIAPCAGHVDELPYIGCENEQAIFEAAARRELEEETGLLATRLSLVFGDTITHLPCRRPEGYWHKWRIYQAQIADETQLHANAYESEQLTWYTTDDIAQLARRTQMYLAGQMSEEAWQASPGIELVWVGFFERLHILPARR